ncbi:MAG: tetratricopeptide repeat protein [Candidatus Latescibacteria bacterium]|nr:tetratricopeptide repeat protein [Candidatus Latescibacterota bacterium]
MKSRRLSAGIALLGLVLGCSRGPEKSPHLIPGRGEHAGVRFVEVTAQSGLDFVQISGGPPQRYILEAMTGGAAFLDYDNDGYLDVFLVNGTRLEAPPPEASNRLYRNVEGKDGERIFLDATDQAGLRRSGWGTGCATGDYDNDGDVDLFVACWGPDLLYRNEGDGSFTDVTQRAGVGHQGWGTSAAFGDLDSDGYLDLYVANYLVFDPAASPNKGEMCRGYKGLETFCGPHGMAAQADVLYRNLGDGRFADMSAATGIDQYRYPGLGVVFTDCDDDGDLDIYVADDSQPNLLFRNDGDWRLWETAAFAGVAYSEEGRSQAGMGVDAGDYDNDGDMDLFATNFSDDVNTLYQNQGHGSFADATAAAGLGDKPRPYLGWGTAFFDADNDGWLDLFIADGHLYPQLKDHPSGLRYTQPNLFYWNERGVFHQASPGPGLEIVRVSRATAFGDYDNDGDVDLLIVNLNDAPNLLRNEGGNRHNWLGLQLVGTQSNRDGIGARVTLFSGQGRQVREVKRGYGYQSQHDGRVLFGLGQEEGAQRVEIRWPSGQVQVLERPPLRAYLVVREGHSEPLAQYAAPAPPAPEPASPQETAGPATAVPYSGEEHWTAEDHYQRGVALYRQGRYEEALEAFRVSLQGRPDHLPTYYSLGVTLFAGLGRSAEAAALLEQAMAKDSSRVEICELLGRVYLSLNRAEEAVAALTRATVLDPSSWENHHRLGLAHLRRTDLEAAKAAFQRAAQAAPWAPIPQLSLARVYENLGDRQAAAGARLAFARLRRAQEGEDTYLQQLREDPVDAEAHARLGREYLKQKRYPEAQGQFRRALELDPRCALAHYGMGAICYYQGRLKEAIAAYTEAYRSDPTLVMALSDLGRAYHRAGRLEEAVATYRQALRLQPDLALASSNLGEVYAAQGKTQEAIAAFRAALELDSTLVDTRDALARLYASTGRLEEAIREWEKVLWLFPEHSTARGWIAQARQRLSTR